MAALLLLAPSALRGAQTFRVDAATGSDTPACGGDAAPCASIQQAVNRSSTTGDSVLVAAGTYVYVPGVDPCVDETAVVCIVGKKVTILGGFASGNWTARDPVANPTIIDGEDFQRGVLVKRTSPTSPSSAALSLEGVTIRRGVAGGTNAAPDDRRGGGLKAGLVEFVVLRDVIFEDNVAAGGDSGGDAGGNGAGGGLSVSSAVSLPPVQATLERVSFSGNQARGGAGAVRGGFGLGGGVFVNQTALDASDLTFENNTVRGGDSSGSGLLNGQRADSLGGGIAILAGATATIEGLVATGNTSTGGSSAGIGGVGAGAGVYVEAASLLLRTSRLQSNVSTGGAGDTGGLGTGGGLTSFDSDVTLERVALIGNQAIGGDGVTTKGSVGGGGAYLQRANDPSVSASLTNCIVADNSVAFGTGGGTIGGGGGGVFILGNDATISHTTFARNSLGSSPQAGQAVSVVPRAGEPSHAELLYSIFADHTSLEDVAAVQVRAGTSANFTRGLFANNERDTNHGMMNAGTITGLGTMLSAPSAGFVSPGAPDFDYHLTLASAAIDEAASSTTELDFDGSTRSSPRDIGADEVCLAAEDDRVLPQETVDGTRVEEACSTITAGPFTVGSDGDVTLRAGEKVILRDGFNVEGGGRLVVEIALP